MTNGGARFPNNSKSKDQADSTHPGQQRSGHNLSRLLLPEPASPGLVIPSFLRVIAAVEETHRENKGPCDLDPRKVFLGSDGSVELSTLVPPASGMTVVLSSSKYSSPEMIEETNGQVDRVLVESYVLGFVFYEILLGRDLFEQQFQEVSGHGKFGWLTWHADKSKRAKPLSAVLDGFPSVLSGLIDGMMAKEASERITDLNKIADTIGAASQATMVISNLSAFQSPDAIGAPAKMSMSQRVDIFWRGCLGRVRKVLRRLALDRILTKRHKQAPSSS